MFCSDVERLLLELKTPQYRPQDGRLFIDSSKRSLKCVLLHNGNKYVSVPIGHSTKLKEEYSNNKLVLEKLGYCDHQWLICVDLNGELFTWSAEWLHPIPMLYLFVR